MIFILLVWSDWHPFTQEEINLIPQDKGIYQLNSGSETMYIGHAINLQHQLLEHLNSDDAGIQKTTVFCYHLSDDPEEFREKFLRKFLINYGKLPICNEKSSSS